MSGSALRCEGQLTTYNHGEAGPCYRCVFPKPAPAATVTNCSDGGVLGAVPGVIGCLQALEALTAMSMAPAAKIYFMDGSSSCPLPLLHMGEGN